MENRAHALIAGLFVILLGIGILITLWWFAGSGQEFKRYELVAIGTITGLNPQAAVRFHGVRVGRVLDIDLDDDSAQRVIVTIRVRSDVPITMGTRAKLGSQGLTGNSYVLLSDDGKDPHPLLSKPGELPQIALQPGNLDQAIDAGRETLLQLKEASGRLNRLLNDNNISNAELALKNIAASTAHLERTLAQTPALIQDMQRFASAENAAKFSDSLTQLQATTQKFAPVIENWNRAIGKVEAAGARVDQLGGDVQSALTGDTLPRINQLTTDLQTTSAQLNRVLDEMQRSPQMLIFGHQPAPLGPGEIATGQDKK
ncbi:MAG TPA: MlaD family protein [Rhodocyclaceae bacterium]|nr:MlaD family protein [Rhodocyclaceae bacterium]